MISGWKEFLVALGLILLFYYARRYFPKQKHPPDLPKRSRVQDEIKPLEMISTKNSVNQSAVKSKIAQSAKATQNTVANLVMHPHSFERAKKEYIQHAAKFSGLYEVLYLANMGSLSPLQQEQLLKSWEDRILATEASNLILAWNTVIQRYCGRNLYYKSSGKRKEEEQSASKEVEKILRDWLKLMFKWGLHREPRAQSHTLHSEGHGGEHVNAQELDYYWVLNGEVIEEGRSKQQSAGQ